jgi:hypothetical protein
LTYQIQKKLKKPIIILTFNRYGQRIIYLKAISFKETAGNLQNSFLFEEA